LLIQLILWCLPLLIVYFIYRKLSKKHNFMNWINHKFKSENKDVDKKE
jgi:hypothetical protein